MMRTVDLQSRLPPRAGPNQVISVPGRWPLRKRLKNGAIFVVIRALIAVLRRLPRRAAVWFMGSLGRIAYLLLPGTRRTTISNLRYAYGDERTEAEIKRMARQVFIDLGRNAADAIRLPELLKRGLDRYVTCVGSEHLDQALARGQGVIIITGHLGCWELLAAYLVWRGYPLAVVGAELYDPRLNKMVREVRESAGYWTISRGPYGTREILRWLRRKGVVGMLIDQDMSVDGVFVDFYNRPAYTPVGPVVLAQKTGAAVVPLAIHRQPDGTHLAEIRPPISFQVSSDPDADRVENVRRCSQAVEAFVRRHPTQWVWMHERWKTQPLEKASDEPGD